MIKYEVIDTGVRILDIGSIERGCGLVYKGTHGEISSKSCPEYSPEYSCGTVFIHGLELYLDDDLLISNDPSHITNILDEYNRSTLDKAIMDVLCKINEPTEDYTLDDFTGLLYSEYYKVIGGSVDWEIFSNDPANKTEACAWVAVALAAIRVVTNKNKEIA